MNQLIGNPVKPRALGFSFQPSVELIEPIALMVGADIEAVRAELSTRGPAARRMTTALVSCDP